MEIRTVFTGLRLTVVLLELMQVVVLGGSQDDLKQQTEPIEALTGAVVSTKASLIKCTMWSIPRLPIFSMDGDFVIGGVFSIHYKLNTVTNNYTIKPEPLRCAGRLVNDKGYVKLLHIFEKNDSVICSKVCFNDEET